MTPSHLNELWGFVRSFIFLAPNKLMESTKMGRAGTEIDGRRHCAVKARWCGNKTVKKQVWMMCLGVSLQQDTNSSSKCDSFHFWQFEENEHQKLPAVLDTRIAASGTWDINDIGVFTWFKPSTSAKEVSACVTKCSWGFGSLTQLWTVGPSQARRILGANGSSPTLFSQRTCQGWHKQGTAQLHCLIWADFPIWAYFHLWLKPSRHNNVPMPAHLTHSMFILPFWLVLGSLGLFPVEIIVSITR